MAVVAFSYVLERSNGELVEGTRYEPGYVDTLNRSSVEDEIKAEREADKVFISSVIQL